MSETHVWSHEDIEGMLDHLSPDVPRAEWWRVLAGVKDALGDAGRDIARAWSEPATNYDKAGFRDTWRSIRPNGHGVGVGTLVHMARAAGWTGKRPAKATAAERERAAERRRAIEERELEKRRKRAEAAARKAQADWDRAEPIDDPYGLPHPYLLARQVGAWDVRSLDGHLLVPVRDARTRNIVGLQRIGADGTKRFDPGTVKAGNFGLVSGRMDAVLLCEGYATAATLREATGLAVAICWDVTNMPAVARALAEQGLPVYPCADHDGHLPVNAGLTAATEAASILKTRALVPPCAHDDKADWNDARRACYPEDPLTWQEVIRKELARQAPELAGALGLHERGADHEDGIPEGNEPVPEPVPEPEPNPTPTDPPDHECVGWEAKKHAVEPLGFNHDNDVVIREGVSGGAESGEPEAGGSTLESESEAPTTNPEGDTPTTTPDPEETPAGNPEDDAPDAKSDAEKAAEAFKAVAWTPERMAQKVRKLAELDALSYDQQRETAADSMGIRVSTLDKAVAQARQAAADNGSDSVVEELAPWDEPCLDGSALLDEIRSDFENYIVAPPEALDAIALWVLGTYCYNAFTIFPKLFLSSPGRRCGKSVTLEVLEANACRGMMASSISASAIFRAVEAWRPTLVLDEADTFASADNLELMGVINAGHRKRTAFVIRTAKAGDDHEPKRFSTWAPMVIAAIGRLRDTVMDRSVVIHMQRKMPGEKRDRLPGNLFDRNHNRRRRCLRWARDMDATIKDTRVELPPHGNDRALDNWEPLFVIATVAGGDWPTRVARAFSKLTVEEEEDAIGPMLLSDIKDVMTERHLDRIASHTLVDALCGLETRPWSEWRRGRPMTAGSLAKLLDPYKIRPGTIRIGTTTAKGYYASQFRDAWARYLPSSPATPPNGAVTTSHPSNGAASGENDAVTNPDSVSARKQREPSNGAACDGVTAQNGGYDGERGIGDPEAPVTKGNDTPGEAF